MKRPLAVFGLVYLFVMLAATELPSAAFFACLGAAALALLVLGLRYRRKRRGGAALAGLAAVCAALLVMLAHRWLVVRPSQMLDGGQHTVTARVMEAAPGSFGDDTTDVTLEILEGLPTGRRIKVALMAFPEAEVGDLFKLDLKFYAFSDKTSARNYARGLYVGARVQGTPQAAGRSVNWLCALRLLQYRAGETIYDLLPPRLSSVAAAMAVGDSRFLTPQTKAAYRMAGLSHTLVVSGMHLSVLSAAAYGILFALTHRRRLAGALCMALVLAFMAFTGISPSIVRSGVVCLLLYGSLLFRRRADVYTSMGLAAVLLCTQNPYAASDAGLLLSFASALGVLASLEVRKVLLQKWKGKPAGRVKYIARQALLLVLPPACVSLAVLPVSILFHFGVPLFSLPMNILALPLATPVVLCGLAMAALGSVPFLAWLAKPFALVTGTALVLLEKLTNLCYHHSEWYVYIGGVLAAALLLLYPLGLLAHKTKRYKAVSAVGVAVVLAGTLLHGGLRAGTVQVSVAGSGANPSLVVTSGDECAIIYRDRRTAYAIQQVMQEQGIERCVLLVDLRQANQSSEYIAMFQPQQIVVAAEEAANQASFALFGGTEILLKKQGEGTVACVDIEGYRVGTSAGAVDLSPYAPLDVFVAGSGEAKGVGEYVIVNGALPGWLSPQGQATVLTSTGQSAVVVRPGKSVLFKEVSADGNEE